MEKKIVLSFSLYNLSIFLVIRKFVGMFKEITDHNCSLSLLHLESMVSRVKLKKNVVVVWSCNLIYFGPLCLQSFAEITQLGFFSPGYQGPSNRFDCDLTCQSLICFKSSGFFSQQVLLAFITEISFLLSCWRA